jgi:hypothetical protein
MWDTVSFTLIFAGVDAKETHSTDISRVAR